MKIWINWERSCRVQDSIVKGTYVLETLAGEQIPITWNIEKLKRYYIDILTNIMIY